MLKIKSIKKEGKHLTIIIKKPKFKRYKDFIEENNLIFDSEIYECDDPILNLNGDIELKFVLRNIEDLEPYLRGE